MKNIEKTEKIDIVFNYNDQDLQADSWRIYGDHRGCYRRGCSFCGKVFYAQRPEGLYCSPVCRQRAHRRRLKNVAKNG